MGNLQAIPAIKCENRMKNIMTGNFDSSLSNRCEGLNPENVYKTLYPQDADPLSQYKKEEGKLISGDPTNPEPLSATSAADCAKKCDQNLTHGCKAFEYYSGDQTCNIYESTNLTDGSTAETYTKDPAADSHREGVPEWMESYYQNYPKSGKPGDYRCKYSAVDQSCQQVAQISCPKPMNGGVPGDIPINGDGGGDTFHVAGGGYSGDAKIRVDHIGFNRCQTGGDSTNCLHDIYTVNAFGFPTSHGKTDPPLNKLLYAKPYNVLYGKFAVACPSDTHFIDGADGSNIGCFGRGEPAGCMPTFYPFETAWGATPVANKCSGSLADEMYITDHKVDPSFEAGKEKCSKMCNKKGDECTGFISYKQNGKERCVLYKQQADVLNNNMYSVNGTGVVSMVKNKYPYPQGPVANAQPVRTEYQSLETPLLFCPSTLQETDIDQYGNVYCGNLDNVWCRSAYDPYSKDLSNAKPIPSNPSGICQSYSPDASKRFFANQKGEFIVESEKACKNVCDYNPKCTGYSVRKQKGQYYCTPYALPVEQMHNVALPNGAAPRAKTAFKTVGGCPGSLVRDRGGNCVMKFNNRLLGEPSSGNMAGRTLGGGIMRDPEPNNESGTAFMGYF